MQLLLAVLGRTYAQNSIQSQRGQSTVEYVMVTFAAGTLAYALIKVMNIADKVATIFNKVIDAVLGMF